MRHLLLASLLFLVLSACGGGGAGTQDIGGTLQGGGAQTSAQIAAVRGAADGPTNLAVTQAIVTGTFPPVGTSSAGFFVQAEVLGPALMVLVDPGLLTPAPVPGSVVSFTVTSVATNFGLKSVNSITGYVGVGVDAVAPLIQSVNAVDFTNAANVTAFESEVVSLSATIASTFTTAETGFVQAQLTTAGTPTGTPLFVLRVPTGVQTGLSLAQGCTFTLNPAWLLRLNNNAQVTVWTTGGFSSLSCPP